jgi:hypothetical protein
LKAEAVTPAAAASSEEEEIAGGLEEAKEEEEIALGNSDVFDVFGSDEWILFLTAREGQMRAMRPRLEDTGSGEGITNEPQPCDACR